MLYNMGYERFSHQKNIRTLPIKGCFILLSLLMMLTGVKAQVSVSSNDISTTGKGEPKHQAETVMNAIPGEEGILCPPEQTLIPVRPVWNLVSIPRWQSNYNAEFLFPDKYRDMYSYNMSTNDYETRTTLKCGPGYWVNYQVPSTVPIKGDPTGRLTVTANRAGWILVGSHTTVVQVSSLELNNGAEILGYVYRYDPSVGIYRETSVINPGEACWVYVTKACTITIP